MAAGLSLRCSGSGGRLRGPRPRLGRDGAETGPRRGRDGRETRPSLGRAWAEIRVAGRGGAVVLYEICSIYDKTGTCLPVGAPRTPLRRGVLKPPVLLLFRVLRVKEGCLRTVCTDEWSCAAARPVAAGRAPASAGIETLSRRPRRAQTLVPRADLVPPSVRPALPGGRRSSARARRAGSPTAGSHVGAADVDVPLGGLYAFTRRAAR